MNPFLKKLIAKYPDLAECVDDILETARVMETAYARGSKVLICGNGGSAADAEHLVGELMKGYLSARPIPAELREQLRAAYPDEGEYLAAHLQGALPTISLVSQTSLITAYANDVAADMIFAQQVYGYGARGDVLMGISTSGNSRNVLHATRVARARGLSTVGFTGRTGGALKSLCDVCVRVPFDATADVQERQLAIYHALCAMLEEALFSTRQQTP